MGFEDSAGDRQPEPCAMGVRRAHAHERVEDGSSIPGGDVVSGDLAVSEDLEDEIHGRLPRQWRHELDDVAEQRGQAAVVDYEAETIARSIRSALDEQVSVPRTNRDIEAGMPTHVGMCLSN